MVFSQHGNILLSLVVLIFRSPCRFLLGDKDKIHDTFLELEYLAEKFVSFFRRKIMYLICMPLVYL
jgi:hypothetical protein